MPCLCENCSPADEFVSVGERLHVLERYCQETMKLLQAANVERERLRRLLSALPVERKEVAC